MENGKISNPRQLHSLLRYTITDGAMAGLRIIDCQNGKFHFLLNESKALDVMQMFFCGENLSFVSKNGFTARELPFGKRFEGGALYTCGLDAVGELQGHETHGDLHNTPATVTRAECGEDGIYIEAHMRDSALFGRNLLLVRKIFSPYGSARLEITDTLLNEGTTAEPYALLYHVNLGYPLLNEDGIIDANTCIVTPRNEHAGAHLKAWNKITAPQTNFAECCYFLDLPDGRISYKNTATRTHFTLTYSKETLPKFILWKSMACGDYALGLEPSTTELDGGFSFATIKPGEEKQFFLSMSVEREETT